MALEGPRLFYSLDPSFADDEPAIARALRLAREVEELLGETASTDPNVGSAHSPRIAQAMAASLVDELSALVRGARRTTGLS